VESLLGVLALVVGLALIVGGAELFFAGLLATAARFRLSPFTLRRHGAVPLGPRARKTEIDAGTSVKG
jgi:hypothetical protein